jgi:hypothetical protein
MKRNRNIQATKSEQIARSRSNISFLGIKFICCVSCSHQIDDHQSLQRNPSALFYHAPCLSGVADAFGEGAAALAGDFDEAGVAGDLVEERQGAFGFGENALAQVIFKLQ